jgi:hypothetical protein
MFSGGVVANACCEVAHGNEFLVRLQEAMDQAFEVEPKVASPLLPDAEVEVESIDVGGNSFCGTR